MAIDFQPDETSTIDFQPDEDFSAHAVDPIASRLQQGFNPLRTALASGAENFGGNILEDIGKLVKSDVIDQYGQKLLKRATANMQNSNPAQQLVALGTQYAPFAAASLIPGLGEGVLGSMGAGAIGGASQSQQHRLANAALGAAGGAALGAVPALSNAVGQGLQFGKALVTPGIGQEITGTLPKDVLNKTNTENVINNYVDKLSQSSAKYKDLKDAATNVAIKPYQRTLNSLDTVLQRRGVDPDLTTTLQRYKDNPSFSNAHELQSALGKESASFKASLAKTPEDTITQRLLNNARGDINNRIEQTFKNSGNDDLLNQYKDATNYFKNNVLPYRQKSSIWRVINGKEYPLDITKVLTKEDQGGYNNILRSHIADNPDQARSLVAQALHTAADPDSKLGFVPLKKLLSNADNMPSSIKEIADKVGLSDQLKNLSKVYKTRKAIGWGATGLGALLGADEARKLL